MPAELLSFLPETGINIDFPALADIRINPARGWGVRLFSLSDLSFKSRRVHRDREMERNLISFFNYPRKIRMRPGVSSWRLYAPFPVLLFLHFCSLALRLCHSGVRSIFDKL